MASDGKAAALMDAGLACLGHEQRGASDGLAPLYGMPFVGCP